MRILAIDLAWAGPSGWVVWGEGFKRGTPMAKNKHGFWIPYDNKKEDQEVAGFLDRDLDPIQAYGDFQTKRRTVRGDLVRIRVGEIYDNITQLIHTYDESKTRLLVVYEQTDWHQKLTPQNYRNEYSRERRVQRGLGRAEATLLLAAISCGIETYSIGANEAKKEFGALRKDACARLLASEWDDRFEFQAHNHGFLYDKLNETYISDHISDAMVIASVVHNRLRHEDRLAT